MPASLKLDHGRLTAELAEQYREDGFLFPIRAVGPEVAAGWRAELEVIEADWLDAGLPLPLSTYKRVNAQVVMPLAIDIASHPAILDAVEGILGPDLMLYGLEFFIKEARTRQIVTMHQDLAYWGLGETHGMTTAWLALSPAMRASGCMDFVRASHKNPILPHRDTFDANNLLSRGQEIEVDVAEEDRTPIELSPGQMSLHHGLTFHGSGPNLSDDRRIGVVIRYIRPDIAQQSGAPDYALLLRGEDRYGNFLSFDAPKTLFAPEALATYERIRTEKSRVLMRGAKGSNPAYATGGK